MENQVIITAPFYRLHSDILEDALEYAPKQEPTLAFPTPGKRQKYNKRKRLRKR